MKEQLMLHDAGSLTLFGQHCYMSNLRIKINIKLHLCPTI